MNPVKPRDVRILVVDDDPDVLAGRVRLLQQSGYQVDQAADGAHALAVAQQRQPDLILLDRHLPDTDGLEVCRRIKRDPTLADVLVVIASASAVASDAQAEGLESGADGYISCPIANRELLARVDAFVRIVSLTRSLRKQESEAQKATLAAVESSAASLNLMEDAIEAQRKLEATNEQLRREIKEREEAEIELKRVNRALRVVSSATEAMVHASEEPKLLQEICRIAVEAGGYRMAWVGFAEADEFKTVRPVACAGNEDGYLASARISWADVDRGRGPTGAAIRTGQPCVCQNLLEDPKMAPWRESALRRGFAASLAIPLQQDGHPIGALTIYAQEAGAFNPSEAKLLGELSEDLSFGIAALRAQRGREEAAAALRASEERYRLLFEDNPLAMWLYDDETLEFVAVNATAIRNYGYSRDEFLKMSIKQIVPDEDLAELLDSLSGKRAKASASAERRHRRKDGSIIHVEVVSRPLVFNGRTAHLVLAADVTEKKVLEDKFLHAQRLESIGMLAAGIAHDLNNVLAPIVFAAPMLRDSLTGTRDLKIINTLEASAARGAGLVKQILGFVHSTSGEFLPTQVKHLARDIVSVIEETFPKAITFEHHVPTNLWPVRGNATQIHQVLLNLCVNARDAMPNGGALTFTIANRRLTEAEAAPIPEARPGAWLMIEVRDTGTGIPPEVLKHIWTPFFTTKGVGKGTGLGLTTVRSIVLSHGGFIELDTVVGRGTTFRAYLPAIETDLAPASSKATADLHRGQDEPILVVDDDAGIRDVITATLDEYGYHAVGCANGAEALALIKAAPAKFSVVISDVDMPVMGGIELAEAVRQLRPEIRIVGISGYASSSAEGSKVPTMQQLAHGFIHKPFALEELLRVVHQVLTTPGPT